MKILALDTTTMGCSVALCDGNDLIAELSVRKKQTHSKHLMEMIDQVLRSGGLLLSEVDAFAVARGPGSFTGLRIGLSTAKGLSFVTGKPLAGVSSLEALAKGIAWSDIPVCTLIDARKHEMYMGCYSLDGGNWVAVEEPCVAGPEEICTRINRKTLFIGTGVDVFGTVLKKALGSLAVFTHPSFHEIRARSVAQLGYTRILDKGKDETLQITPSYIRKSDAEINYENSAV